MKITKAIITAAGAGQRHLPLQTLIDRDGLQKSVLNVIIQEAVSAGIEDTCLVIHPDDEPAFRSVAGDYAGRLTFVYQPEPRGYGHALWCAREFAGGDPFLHLIGDHLYVSRRGEGCARLVVKTAEAQSCAVSAVQATRESLLHNFGAVSGRRVQGRNDLYAIDDVVEKPTPTEAEQRLLVPGLRSGYYLCFFGIHVLTPAVMDLLARELETSGGQPVSLSPSLAELARREKYLALELAGRRYNIGERYGLFAAQLALALEGREREEVLAQIVELLAQRELAAEADTGTTP